VSQAQFDIYRCRALALAAFASAPAVMFARVCIGVIFGVVRPMKSEYPSSLPRLIAELKRDRPDVYLELRRRYVESILAIEHGQATSFDDNTDPDCEDQLPLLQRDLINLGILRG
jgi:hypothetical protein